VATSAEKASWLSPLVDDKRARQPGMPGPRLVIHNRPQMPEKQYLADSIPKRRRTSAVGAWLSAKWRFWLVSALRLSQSASVG